MNQLSILVHSLEKMLYVLGIEFEKVVMSEEDKNIYKSWKDAVKERDFEKADAYRNKLMEKGIL